MRLIPAQTFIRSVGKLDTQAQTLIKTTVMDLQFDLLSEGRPRPGLSFHKIDRTVRDPGIRSISASPDLRVILHHAGDTYVLLYAGHHDAAYNWASRRRLQPNPETGAMQLVDIEEVTHTVTHHVTHTRTFLFQQYEPRYLISLGVPRNGCSRRREEHVTLLRTRTLLLLLSHTGLRIQEALDLAWDDVHLDEDEPSLTVRSGKGRKSRTVQLSDRLVTALRTDRQLSRRRSHAPGMVLPFRTRAAASKLLRPLFERPGEVDVQGQTVSDWRGCHAFRKHTGTRLYEALGDFAAVAEVLGHADINTTRAYVRVASGRAGKVMRDW